jgi:hypothetical protein
MLMERLPVSPQWLPGRALQKFFLHIEIMNILQTELQVVFSRISIAAPGMFFLPFIMEKMEKKSWFKSRPFLHAPFQVIMNIFV